MSLAKYIADVDGLFKCSVCLDVFSAPRQLPCRHVFCGACIAQVIIIYRQRFHNLNGQMSIFPTCPLCRAPFKWAIDDNTELDDVAVLNVIKEDVSTICSIWMESTNIVKSIVADIARADATFNDLPPVEILTAFCHTPALTARSLIYKRAMEMILAVRGYLYELYRYMLYKMQPFPLKDGMVAVSEQIKIWSRILDQHIKAIRRMPDMTEIISRSR